MYSPPKFRLPGSPFALGGGASFSDQLAGPGGNFSALFGSRSPANIGSDVGAAIRNIGLPGAAAPAVVPGATGVPSVGVPGNNAGGFFDNMTFGDTADLALSGLQTIGSLWSAFEANKLAKKQFDFTKSITEENLANQRQSYNTALSDRITSRAHTEGRGAEYASSYLNEHSLKGG